MDSCQCVVAQIYVLICNAIIYIFLQVETTLQGDLKSLLPDLYTRGVVVYNQNTLLDQ